MPAQPVWIQELAWIIRAVRALPCPIVNREAMEQLFRVRRRRAQQLIERFGGFQSGRRWLIERETLATALEVMQRDGDVERESRRRTRLEDALAEIRKMRAAQSVKIDVSPEVNGTGLEGLPPTVSLEPFELRVRFEGVEDLLRQLFVLSQAIANDFPRLERWLRGTGGNT